MKMDLDMEAWSPMSLPPSPLPIRHARLTADSKNEIQENLQDLGSRVLSFEAPGRRYIRNRPKYRSRFQVASRLLWLSLLLMSFSWCWLIARHRDRRVENQNMSEFADETRELQFFDARNENIRYVGRWSAAQGNRTDGSFPGVYFEVSVVGTRTIGLSIYNRRFDAKDTTSHGTPISLLALVDDDEYLVFPNATSTVRIRHQDLDPKVTHSVRIIAPMIDSLEPETLQLKGIWLDKGGNLVSPDTHPDGRRRKTLELITDSLDSNASQQRKSISTSQAILRGVVGWQYLLGEMFGADHVRVGMDGMCLIRDCLGGKASPAGVADVFFQSGPPGTEHFSQPWLFEEYVPDVMVMNLGNADWQSFQKHADEYKKTTWNLTVVFEDTYVTLIKAIRALAYPNKPTTVDGFTGIRREEHKLPLPIFVMRPFRGQFEQTTQSVVSRLQLDGDKAVFWLDTSGWLNTNINFDGHVEDQDFFWEEESKDWRLTERGNRRVAMLLHMHICRYLSQDPARCAYLPPTDYETRSAATELSYLKGRVDSQQDSRRIAVAVEREKH